MINTFKVIVSGFVKNKDNQILIIRRSKDEETFPGMLAIPGGTIETVGEGSLETDTVENNLIREIKEETNMDVRVNSWIESTSLSKDGKGKLYLFFSCELIGDQDNLKISDETPEVFWSNVEELDIEQCTPTLKKYILSNKN